MSVEYVTSGAPSDDGFIVNARLTAPASSVRLSATPVSLPIGASYSAPVAPDSDLLVSCPITGLQPGIKYRYQFEVDGTLDPLVGYSKTTSPLIRPIRILHSSCSRSDWLSPVYAAMAVVDSDFDIHAGDMHYNDQVTATESSHRGARINLLKNATARVWFENKAVGAIWDDHDYVSHPVSNCRGQGTYKAVAAAAFRKVMPHHVMPDANALYRSFVDGPVRVIITDLRYYASPNTDVDDATKTMLGAVQKAWFKAECLAAKNAGQFIVWVSSSVWPIVSNAGSNSDLDHWNVFSIERRELADYMVDNGITDGIIVSGDVHALAYMTSPDFSTRGGFNWPVVQAAALARESAPRPADWVDYLDGDDHYGMLDITPVPSGGFFVRWEGHVVTDVEDSSVMAASWNFSRVVPPLAVFSGETNLLNVVDGSGIPLQVYG